MVSSRVKISLLMAASFARFLHTAAGFSILKRNFVSCPSALHVTKNNTDRRGFVGQTAAVAAASVGFFRPSIANAGYGDSSNIILPNYIEYLIEKNKQVDPGSILYKGPDIETQLRRIGDAGSRLPEIATLAEEKKWSQVQGIITGPLGTLLQTMNSVAGVSGTKEAKDLAKLVKNDLIEIGVAAGQKKSDACVKAADKAAKYLEKFVLATFK